MKKTILNYRSLAVGLSLSFITSASAAVTFIGSIEDNSSLEVSRWSDVATIKSFDIDGDNFYGTDGYFWANGSNLGGIVGVLASSAASSPSYTGGIAYSGTGSGQSASFNGAANRLGPAGSGNVNVGYAGVNYAANDTAVQTLQDVFTYTLTRDLAAGETLRLGVVLDSLAGGTETTVGADSLAVVAGGTANAIIVGNSRNSNMDHYFFDISGLSSGDNITIQLANAAASSNANWNGATLGGITFDKCSNSYSRA